MNRWVIRGCAVWALVSIASSEPSVRVAILAPPSLRAVEELLSADWSKESDLIVLERATVERILAEQALSLETKDPLSAGRLTRADALLLMDLQKNTARTTFTARAVRVADGIVAAAYSLEWDAGLLDKIPELLSSELLPAVRNSAVADRQAQRWSMGGVHASSSTPDAERLRDDFLLLFTRRALLEPGVVLLDRDRAREMLMERALTEGEETTPWTGSLLIEASVARDPESGTLSADWAVELPDGRRERVRLEEQAGQLVSLVDRSVRTLTELGGSRGTSTVEWLPEAEAQRYAERMAWAFQSGRYTLAFRFAEVARALGKDDDDFRSFRLRVRAALIYPMHSVDAFDFVPAAFRLYGVRFAIEEADETLPEALQELRRWEGRFLPDDAAFNAPSVLASATKLLRHVEHHGHDFGRADALNRIRSGTDQLATLLLGRAPPERRRTVRELARRFDRAWTDPRADEDEQPVLSLPTSSAASGEATATRESDTAALRWADVAKLQQELGLNDRRYDIALRIGNRWYLGFSAATVIESGDAPERFVARESGIAEYDLETRRVRLIAWSARRPPQTVLDGITPYGVYELREGADGWLRARIFQPERRPQLNWFLFNGEDWIELPGPSEPAEDVPPEPLSAASD